MNDEIVMPYGFKLVVPHDSWYKSESTLKTSQAYLFSTGVL